MVKLVDALDSKSSGSDTVPVRFRPRAPTSQNALLNQGFLFILKARKDMASSVDYLEFILDLLREVRTITYKKMMGEFMLYKDGILFGGVYDNRFLIKKTKSLEDSGLKDQIPYPSAKPMLLVDSEDPDEIKELVDLVIKDLKK